MSTPEEIEYQQRVAAAMMAESPNPLARKRKNPPGRDGENSEEEDDDNLPVLSSDAPVSSDAPSPGATSNSGTNSNMVAFARQYATHKRLKASQVTEVEAFAADNLAARQVKLFTVVLGLGSKLDSIVTAQPAFKISAALDKNLRQLAHGITISPKLASYKGDLAKTHLLNIVKKQRFDLPPGIENIASDWSQVKARGEYHLTQVRSNLKKFLKASMPEGPASTHQNIFALGQRFVKDTEATLTVELCARIALMRQQHKFHPGENFWDKLDKELARLRKQGDFDEHKISKGFKIILAEDRAQHGKSTEYTLPEDAVASEWQASVDESIHADGADP
ncbi:hypothetical protein MSAN_01956600 [Mycena sanguinolenta]|uniref:Uncharacterized protein n=1 Tax=Mycena sanguinolenta TaxID=230812 RepID=A0A8H6XNT1_9AGAR|nr:hypothetical protein MSAN_01956600 [Mycena sanguinolenta]